MSFLDWVSASKTAFLNDLLDHKDKDWIVCLGNEAGDLDSVASALALGYILHTSSPAYKSVALHQFQRRDLVLRKENQLALSKANIPAESLLLLDDINKPLDQLQCDFGLVDHNHLAPQFGSQDADSRVKIVIDHHADEGKYQAADPRIIAVSPAAGSCSSLVTTHFRQVQIPTPLADLLLSAILIDTGNLKQGGKAVQVDHDAYAILLGQSSFSQSSSSLAPDQGATTSYFQRLREAKSDILSLSAHDNLRRDYKEYSGETYKLGISSLPTKVADINTKGDLIQGIDDWMRERSLTHFAITASYQQDDKSRRQVLISTQHGLAQIVAEMKELPDLKCTDSPQAWIQNSETTALLEHDNKATRKQIAPALNKILSSS